MFSRTVLYVAYRLAFWSNFTASEAQAEASPTKLSCLYCSVSRSRTGMDFSPAAILLQQI